MIFDLVRLTFLTLVAADLEADLSSALEAVISFEADLSSFERYSTGSNVPTTLTSDYQSFSSALSSFNGALEGVGADDFDSGSAPLYAEAARFFFWISYVFYLLADIALLHDGETGNIFSFIQAVVEDVNEPLVQLVEKANLIMVEDCGNAIYGDDGSTGSWYLLEDVSSFSSRLSMVGEIVTVSLSSLPSLSCLNGASEFSLLKGLDSGPSASQSATLVSSTRSTSTRRSSTIIGSMSRIDSSSPTAFLEGSSTQDESAITSTTHSGAEGSSTGTASVSSDGTPVLVINAGVFALIFTMLL